MMRILSQTTGAIAIAATVHLSFLDLAYAETTEAMQSAAAQANTSEFKTDVSSLYSTTSSGDIEIVGASPAGNVSLGASSLYYGVQGQSASEGSLPDVDSYEDLYGYRDQKLGELEAGTGSYASTGTLNAEASAVEILKGTASMSSVSAEAWLLASRDIVTSSTTTSEFGQCVVKQVTGSSTYTYDNSYTETCDSLGIGLSPMTATRIFKGPGAVFTYTEIGGQGYCVRDSVQIAVDGAATCGKLSILDAAPTHSGGALSAYSCSGSDGCVVIRLAQNGNSDPVTMKFTPSTGIALSAATATVTQMNLEGWATYQGERILTSNGTVAVSGVVGTQGAAQTFGLYEVPKITNTREPTTGYKGDVLCNTRLCNQTGDTVASANGVRMSTESNNAGNQGATTYTFYWDNAVVGTSGTSSVTVGNCTYYQGSSAGLSYYTIYRTCTSTELGDAILDVTLTFDPTLFTEWVYNATQWANILAYAAQGLITYEIAVNETAANENGCVNAFTSSAGSVAEVCGTDIPVDPFTMLTDRAATNITITPAMAGYAGNEDGEDALSTSNSCTALQENTACSFVARQCADEEETGDCSIYENTYQCGSTSTYTSPTVTEVNICSSSLSCMGEECVLNSGTDGTGDLADAASKLAAADMILSDMNCTADPTTSADAATAVQSCTLFQGDGEKCKKVTLGLANCCKTATGVSLSDYLQLAFAISRVSNTVAGTALDNPVTSAWVSLEDLAGNSYSKLTQPLTEMWDSIVGSTEAGKTAASAFSMEAIKQTMMKNAAQWVSQIFGEQAANSIFQVGGGVAIKSGGALAEGTISLTSGAATVMSAVMMAYTIYTLINVLAAILFACTEDEQELMVKRALKSSHYVGEYCSDRVLGVCVKRKESYCVFSSPLSRIFNEQARNQLGISWGTAKSPNCQGITVEQFQSLDMDKVDLSEWTGILLSSGMIDTSAVSDIESLTGSSSTLGQALEGLYEREDAITRNTEKPEGVDLDAARNDAVSDFGTGTTLQ